MRDTCLVRNIFYELLLGPHPSIIPGIEITSLSQCGEGHRVFVRYRRDWVRLNMQNE
jgi:hypothetical protein